MTSVLVVDDEGPVRNSLLRALHQHGFEATAADGYEQAVAHMSENAFDVLLTDLRMAGKDGLALIEAIHSSWPETRPILMSAFASARESQKAIDLGAVRVLCKPFNTDEMLDAVRQAVDSATGFVGTVHGLSLIDMLQMFHYAQRSLTVNVLGNPPGSLSLRDGQLVDARLGDLAGEDALGAILTCPTGALRTSALSYPEQTIRREFQSLLLDHLRRLDEQTQYGTAATADGQSIRILSSGSSLSPSRRPKDSWFDVRSEPARTASGATAPPAEGLENHRDALDAACERVVSFVAGAIACAIVDLESGALLGLNEQQTYAETAANALSVATRELFRGPAVVQIENMVRQQRGDAEDGTHYLSEVQLSTTSTLHFAKTLAGGRVAVMLVTNRSTNLAMAWVQLRSTLPSLEAELHRAITPE